MKIWYLCDGQGCNAKCGLKNPDCRHTSNINHAVNFEQRRSGSYWEADDTDLDADDSESAFREKKFSFYLPIISLCISITALLLNLICMYQL